MRNKSYIIYFLVLSFLLTSCKRDIDKHDYGDSIKPEKEEYIVKSHIDEVEVDNIKEKIIKMSLEEKIGQLLIIGLEEKIVNDTTKNMIEEYKVGGFIYFARNVEDNIQLSSLSEQLKILNKNNPVPLFISMDEEGGRVSRLPKEYKNLPVAKILGDLNDEKLSYNYGQLLGQRLNTVGINLNYAPVLDINSNPENPVIGNRSFGNNVDVVITNGIEVLKGIESEGVIACVKHFPGHGDTSVDSHINLPIVNKTLIELKDLELLPFKSAIENNVDMIMIAHILFPELDPINPSTMSKEIITELLRKELGYNGVVISDDMTMGAIIENYTLELAVLEFLKAGGDIALICHGENNPKKVINFLKESIYNGELTIEDIDEKIYRVLTLKDKYNLKDITTNNMSLEELNDITDEFLQKLKK